MNGMPPFIPDEFRTDVEVLQRFGDAFYQNSSIGKTQLYLASTLRWDSFLKYVNWMKKNNHIESGNDEGSETFRLTEQGREMFHRLEHFFFLR